MIGAEEVRFVEKHITTYPFAVTSERYKVMTTNYMKIKNGMMPEQVEMMLGVPDEILPLYKTKSKNAKPVGHSYWYVLRRAKKTGSVKEKDESLVRVSFDISGKVMSVDYW